MALSAGVFNDDRERCVACGMNDFLAKPVLKPDLEKILQKYIKSDSIYNSDKERDYNVLLDKMCK